MSTNHPPPHHYGFWEMMDDTEKVFSLAASYDIDLSSVSFSLHVVQDIPAEESNSGHPETYYLIAWKPRPEQVITPQVEQFLNTFMPVKPAFGDVGAAQIKFPLVIRHITLRLASQHEHP